MLWEWWPPVSGSSLWYVTTHGSQPTPRQHVHQDVAGAIRSVQFRPFNQLGRRGNTTDDSAEILFQCFLQEAIVSTSGMGMDVHSLMLSIQHFLCQPRRRPFFKVPWRVVLERLLWRFTCPKRFQYTHKEDDGNTAGTITNLQLRSWRPNSSTCIAELCPLLWTTTQTVQPTAVQPHTKLRQQGGSREDTHLLDWTFSAVTIEKRKSKNRQTDAGNIVWSRVGMQDFPSMSSLAQPSPYW